MPSYGLMRQIGEQKWWTGVFHLESNPQLNEIEVAAHYSGWRYVLTRTEVKDVYERNTYYGGKAVGLSTLDARPIEQSDNEDEAHTTALAEAAAADEADATTAAGVAARYDVADAAEAADADETETDQPIHYCNDRLCNWDCGTLWCGCIDVCRGRCGSRCGIKGSDW
jgi:hypothetical protein